MVFLPDQNGCRLRYITKEMSPYIEYDVDFSATSQLLYK